MKIIFSKQEKIDILENTISWMGRIHDVSLWFWKIHTI